MADTPIVLILGPSGAGKSCVARSLRDVLGMLWFEADRKEPDGRDGVDADHLRDEWHSLSRRHDAVPLVNALRRRADAAGATGSVFSLPSTIAFDVDTLDRAERDGLVTVIPLGTADECLRAFLEREGPDGRDERHWRKFNERTYKEFAKPEMARFRVSTFEGGKHRAKSGILADVTARFRAPEHS